MKTEKDKKKTRAGESPAESVHCAVDIFLYQPLLSTLDAESDCAMTRRMGA